MELTNRTVLIVDDNADDRFFMSKALERVAPGIVAEYVVSGEEAVAYLKGQGDFANRLHFPFPSFVITDLEMPQGDGFSVLEEIQRTPPANVLPVLMLSSSHDPEHVRRAYELGATSYHLKPTGRTALCVVLSAFFDGYLNGHVSGPARSGDADRRLLCL